MDTWKSIITSALLTLEVRALGDAIDDAEYAESFTRLKWMLDAWVMEGLLTPSPTSLAYESEQAGTQVYTMGPSGSVPAADIESPVLQQILSLAYYPSGSRVGETLEQISLGTLQRRSGIYALGPTSFHYVPSYPLAQLSFDASMRAGDSFILTGYQPLLPPDVALTVNNVDTKAAVPPEYIRGIVMNLAVELGPVFGVQARPEVMREAIRQRNNMQARNSQPMGAELDPFVAAMYPSTNMLYGGAVERGYSRHTVIR